MKGKVPINKGVPMTDQVKANFLIGSQHRYFPVGIFDDMNNLVASYSSVSETSMHEGGRSHLTQCLKHNKL
jgi:hypothetical protein